VESEAIPQRKLRRIEPAAAGTVKPRKKLIIDVRRRCDVLRQIEAKHSYDSGLLELSEIARDTRRAIEERRPGAVKTGGEVIKEWRRQKRYLAELFATPAPMYYRSNHDPEPAPAAASTTRPRTISLPRTRSREQSHAPRRSARSTPKAASRSGDSDPAGDPEPPRRRRFIVDDHYVVMAVVG
jgi:hypothetical protein